MGFHPNLLAIVRAVLRNAASAGGAALILATGDIADVAHAVFETPMAAGERQQPVGIRLVGRQNGNGVDRLDAFETAHEAGSGDATDLRRARLGGGGPPSC